MRAFGAVAIDVFAVVVVPLNGVPEKLPGCLDFLPDFRQIGEL